MIEQAYIVMKQDPYSGDKWPVGAFSTRLLAEEWIDENYDRYHYFQVFDFPLITE